MRNVSTLRVLVEESLEAQGTSLAAYITAKRGEGKAIRAIAIDLKETTGIPIAWRTLYRWQDSLETAS